VTKLAKVFQLPKTNFSVCRAAPIIDLWRLLRPRISNRIDMGYEARNRTMPDPGETGVLAGGHKRDAARLRLDIPSGY
jgi:hypothetical protein